MPHGLSIDNEENLWLTNVAMHQVFKYKNGQRILTLGELFIPGSDSSHFCKPTDIVISKNRSFIYISDGYCNSRFVKFDSNGKYLKEYSVKLNEQQLLIPHSLIFIESLNLLCVADREIGRIVCFNAGFNNENDERKVNSIIKHSSMNTVYAITYNKYKTLGYTFSVDQNSFGKLLDIWKPNDTFGEPHDLTLSIDGKYLFVGEIRPNRILSFDII